MANPSNADIAAYDEKLCKHLNAKAQRYNQNPNYCIARLKGSSINALFNANQMEEEKHRETILNNSHKPYAEVIRDFALCLNRDGTFQNNKRAFAYSLAKIARTPNCEEYDTLLKIFIHHPYFNLWYFTLLDLEKKNPGVKCKKAFFYKLFEEFIVLKN